MNASNLSSPEFFFDFGSPTAYLAAMRLDDIEKRTGATFVWRPVLIGGIFKAVGNQAPALIPAKGKWMFADITRFAARHNTPFAMNPAFPINTITLMRTATALDMQGRLRPFADIIFKAIWSEKKNLGDPAVLRETLKGAGFDADELLTLADSAPAKDKLRAATEEAVARGAFGAPIIFVGDEMHFGQDRLDFVEEALMRRA